MNNLADTVQNSNNNGRIFLLNLDQKSKQQMLQLFQSQEVQKKFEMQNQNEDVPEKGNKGQNQESKEKTEFSYDHFLRAFREAFGSPFDDIQKNIDKHSQILQQITEKQKQQDQQLNELRLQMIENTKTIMEALNQSEIKTNRLIDTLNQNNQKLKSTLLNSMEQVIRQQVDRIINILNQHEQQDKRQMNQVMKTLQQNQALFNQRLNKLEDKMSNQEIRTDNIQQQLKTNFKKDNKHALEIIKKIDQGEKK